MAITIDGSANTIAGLAVGGLPDNTIDNGCMADDAIGVAELSATGTASSSTFLRGDNSWAAAGGGIDSFDSHRVTSNFSGTADPITNWERDDTTNGFAPDASKRVTESSGVFSFPSTGFWHIYFHIYGYYNGDVDAYEAQIKCTTDDTNYNVRAMGYSHANNDDGGNLYFSANATCIFDVTDTDDCKVRFRTAGNSGQNEASSSQNNIYAIFMRLCDT